MTTGIFADFKCNIACLFMPRILIGKEIIMEFAVEEKEEKNIQEYKKAAIKSIKISQIGSKLKPNNFMPCSDPDIKVKKVEK